MWNDDRYRSSRPWIDPRKKKTNPNDDIKKDFEKIRRAMEASEEAVVEGLQKQASQLFDLARLSDKILTEFLFDVDEQLRTTAKNLIDQGNTKGPEFSIILSKFYNLVDIALPHIVSGKTETSLNLFLTLIAKELNRSYKYIRMFEQARQRYLKEQEKRFEEQWTKPYYESTWR